jgi:hypothetical protein
MFANVMIQAQDPAAYMGDLPEDEEAHVMMTQWLTEADEFMVEAEIRRIAAAALGTEIQRGADHRGFIIDNQKKPPLDPPSIRWDPAMASTPYQSICPPASRNVKWNTVAEKAQRLIEEALGRYCGRQSTNNYVAPVVDVCRVTNSRHLFAVRKRYNDLRGQMNTYVRFANERRYTVMYAMARVRIQVWPSVARPIKRYTPHRQTETDEGDQERARDRYQAWMKEVALMHGRLLAVVPEPGEARDP